MGWLIGRAAAMSDPEAARRKALEKLQGIAEMDDPEGVVVPILLDAILLVESYRGARHQITFLDDLTGSVDALLRELTIVEKSRLWAAKYPVPLLQHIQRRQRHRLGRGGDDRFGVGRPEGAVQ